MLTIRKWLEDAGLDQYIGVFEVNEITLDLATELSDTDLKELGMSIMGHRKIFFRAISEIRPATNIGSKKSLLSGFPSESLQYRTLSESHLPKNAGPSPAPSEAERRQLTVMFCDLVDSTALSTKYDPEELREMMGAYQTTAGAVIESYDGHVAQYLGDGLMVYFGWPHAHEDDAVRAVQAGLGVIDAVKQLNVPIELSVRVGIATGPVVIGETGGGDPSVPKTAVGETPNLAARVQGMAEPDTVAIGGITRGLIGSAFELEELGAHSLKGIAEPVELFRVLGDKGAESRFEATYTDHLTPVVGRDSEIALQLDRWQRAKDGEGQVILLSGEPGIGKSRLIHMLREKLAEETYIPIRYQCSTHHANSAFYPVIDQLERAAGFTREENNDSKLDKLEALLGQSTTNVKEIARLFATLLSLSADRYPVTDATPQQLKEQTIGALNDQLVGLSSQNPVMFLVEDVQWCDPTTLELISDAITRIIDARVLLVITYRPEFEPTWTGHAHVSVQTLNRLSRREGTEVVEKVTGGKSLPKEVLDLIVAKTDGIPLYVEELTKNVLEAGFLKDAGDRYELDGPLPSLAIPTTLQESLIARLDRLNTVKQVAQIGSCIGREFTHELVSTVSPLSDSELQTSFQQLIESQIILPQGGASHGSYIFKHALLQDAAYASLLRGPKRQFHDLISEGLKTKFPEVAVNTPELLASHLAKAERFSEAVDYWKEAGLRAAKATATHEAVSHFAVALEYLEKEEPSPERDKRELELQAPLATATQIIHGHGSSKTGAIYDRAFKLTRNMDSPPQLFQILYGLSSNRMNGERFMEGLSIAEELANYANTMSDKVGYAIAHRWYGSYLLWLPDYETAKMHLEKAILAYEELNFNRWIDEYGQDPKARSLNYVGHMEAYLGFPDRATETMRQSISYAQSLDSPFEVQFLHACTGIIHFYLNNIEQTQQHAAAQYQIANDKNLSWAAAHSLVFSGWAENQKKEPGSLEKIKLGLQQMESFGSTSFDSIGHWWLAYIDAAIRSRHYEAANKKIEYILSTIASLGCNAVLPEVLRLKGLCCVGLNGNSLELAETVFLQSMTEAKKHKNKIFELRTALSLAQILGENGERKKAHKILLPVYESFSEGFETGLLQDSRILLNQLN